MDSPKNDPAIQYKTRLAPHKLPVARINQYWTISKPKGLKNRAAIIHHVAMVSFVIFLLSTVTVHVSGFR